MSRRGWFTGKCSNCKSKGVKVHKLANAQICRGCIAMSNHISTAPR